METQRSIKETLLQSEGQSNGHLKSELLSIITNALEKKPSHSDHPYVTLTYAQSLDGCISAEAGKSFCLSNDQSMTLTHHLRALHDCILVGINTVVSDDPRLTVRLVNGNDPQPIVVDTHLKISLNSKLLTEVPKPPIIICSDNVDQTKMKTLIAMGAKIVHSPLDSDGLLDLHAILKWLNTNGFKRLMVEGGGKIITNFLANRLSDQVILTICPVFIGGMHAFQPPTSCGNIHRQLSNINMEMLDEDLVLRGDLI